MKMVKSLILGSAAGLVAMSGAQAADLPVKAKAVEYVRICSLYGAGFYYIPGTDTCIKLGGYLRVDTAGQHATATTPADTSARRRREQSLHATTSPARSREDLNIDTRTATEYGVVRTYFDATFTWTTGSYAGTGTRCVPRTARGTSARSRRRTTLTRARSPAARSASTTPSSSSLASRWVRPISQFSAPWTNYPGNNFDGLVGGGGTVTGVNQFTYTC